ncbi:uncharacterized protein [Lepisosteus oculatus]|uniref:uncharacterized protein isoform X1 n=1 Tax=Lepisosteus oculatus TaxID=7918 RepID=UPI0035F524D5
MEDELHRAGSSDLSMLCSQESWSFPDLEKAFIQDHSLSISALSGLAPRSEIVVEYVEGHAGMLAPQNRSPALLSPSPMLLNVSLAARQPGVTSAPLNSKSSTPCEGQYPKKPTLQSSPELSGSDLSVLPPAAQPPWEISLIRGIQDSPQSPLESSLLDVAESTWSPALKSAPCSFHEGSNLPWGGLPNQANLSTDLHRSWKESTTLGYGHAPSLALPFTEDQWQRYISTTSSGAESKDPGLSG